MLMKLSSVSLHVYVEVISCFGSVGDVFAVTVISRLHMADTSILIVLQHIICC